ncbi:peptidoglycan DD-metalloendopeptidase family protein [Oligella sp. MSHR50489EDL]
MEAGKEIGSVGNTGRSKGNHLHFEWLAMNNWNNPAGKIDPTPLLHR